MPRPNRGKSHRPRSREVEDVHTIGDEVPDQPSNRRHDRFISR